MEMEHCRFSLNFSPFSDILVGSCNGLVCFQKEDPVNQYVQEVFAICNPLTGEFIFLKPNFSRVWEDVDLVSSGFGYCPSTREYKVVRIYAINGGEIGSKIMKNYYSHETLMEMEHCRFTFSFSPYCDMLVGSCNGLVCFEKLSQDPYEDSFEPFAICNPLTGEFIFLNPTISRVEGRHTLVNSGFGYCHSTNEYKVVRLYTSEEGYYGSYAQVYTIGSNKWREIDTHINHTFCASAIFANGVLHWLDSVVPDITGIVTFDLEDEKFGELPLPPPEAYELDDDWKELKLLGENLCWVKRNNTGIHIWAYKKTNNNTRCGMDEYDLKHDYYSKNSWNWVKEFNIECGRYNEPFAITKSNQVLMLCGKILYCYDPKARTISKLGDEIAMGFSKVEVIPHANSYVSLKDSGETWYGPGCSAVPRTHTCVSMSEVKEAYDSHKRKRQS